MKILFVTGNSDKVDQAKILFKDSQFEIEQLKLDIPEVQSLNGQEVINKKFQYYIDNFLEDNKGPFFVEDTSFYMDALNGFPGPLAKYMYKAIGADGFFNIANAIGNIKCHATTRVYYYDQNIGPNYFEGTISGKLVKSKVYLGHGFEDVFLPDGQTQTLSEIDSDKRPLLNMRGAAILQLKDLLNKNYKG